MKPAELEIILLSGSRTTQVVEFDNRATTKAILRTAQQLCRTCGWRKVRVGLGPNWSNWIF